MSDRQKIEFETFRNLENSHTLRQLKKDKPSNVNFLEYRKYKVTVELVEEPNEVLIKRLENLKDGTRGYDKKQRLKKEIELLSNGVIVTLVCECKKHSLKTNYGFEVCTKCGNEFND